MSIDGERRRSSEFNTTRWSLVASAADKSSPEAVVALQQLCQIYWQPLYVFAKRKTSSSEEAQDLTQSFFVELLEKNVVAAAVPQRGKFRAYLITAFKHFMAKEWTKERTQKRGGGRVQVSLDFRVADSNAKFDPESGLTAEQLFDQQWAMALLDRVLSLLKNEFVKAGLIDRYEALKGYVIGDHLGTTYSEVAHQLGISEDAAKKSASRMRKRYRELMRQEIAQTVSQAHEIDEEIRCLFAVLQQ